MQSPIKFAFALLLLAGMPALAREEFTRDFHRDVPLPAGQKVSIENRFGDVVVRGQPKSEVVYKSQD